MDIEKLKDALEPWVRTESWHTLHPSDEAAFHRALARAIAELGSPIEAEVFAAAVRQLVVRHHPNYQARFLDEIVERVAQAAESISTYVHNTRSCAE